jgi:hypothetical protein
MEDQETRRKIIRQWMALPKDKPQTEKQVATRDPQPCGSDAWLTKGAGRHPTVRARAILPTRRRFIVGPGSSAPRSIERQKRV